MPTFTLNPLLDQAVVQLFDHLGRHQPFTVRHMLQQFRVKEPAHALAQPLLARWLPDARLKPALQQLTVQDLWASVESRQVPSPERTA